MKKQYKLELSLNVIIPPKQLLVTKQINVTGMQNKFHERAITP